MTLVAFSYQVVKAIVKQDTYWALGDYKVRLEWKNGSILYPCVYSTKLHNILYIGNLDYTECGVTKLGMTQSRPSERSISGTDVWLIASDRNNRKTNAGSP